MKLILPIVFATSTRAAFVPTSTHHQHVVDVARSTSTANPEGDHTTSALRSRAAFKSSLQMSSFLDNLPNPFSDNDSGGVQPRPPSVPPPISNEPDALFSRSKAIVASDLGLRDPSILSDDFTWVGPNVVSTGTLSRDEYLAAGQFFNLRKAFPDLDYRAHDFRLDPLDPMTVRLTVRTVGTMRGELRLRSETLPPNGKRMVCPPESISMTFDPNTGKLTKLCSGFCMDRLVGNTGGLCGVMAAATVAGSPPSEWELYPPSVVVSRFFRRSVKQLNEPDQFFLAPFPESVMIQLAKGVLAADTGTKDPDLLADEFTFCGPFVGPLNKNEFLQEFSDFELRKAFPDLNENYSNFRVDPYDPYRVWYDVKATGTRTGVLMGKEPDGSKLIGPAEVASMTFDDDGFCTRMTGGAVIDPTESNTGGLGGVFGILYASGAAPPSIASRPLPQILSRIQKGLLSPLTGKDVDDFSNVSGINESSRTRTIAPPKPPTPPTPTQVLPAAPKENPVVNVAAPEPPKVKRVEIQPKESTPATRSSPTLNIAKASIPPPKATPPKVTPPAVKTAPQTPKATISDEPADPVSDVFASFFGSNTESKPEPKTKVTPTPKRKVTPAGPSAEEKRNKALAAAEAKRQEAEARRAKALAAAEEKKKLAEQKKDALKKAKAKEAEKILSEAKPRATISLGFFGFGQKSNQEKEEDSSESSAGAPRGVPTLKNWRQNSDGSLTGLIYGSKVFGAGESITTSTIGGNLAENTVVSTKTGSKYYLGKKSPVGRRGFFGFGGGGNEKKAASPKKPNERTFSVQKERKVDIEAANRAKAEAAAKRKEELELAKRERIEEAARQKTLAAAAAARKKDQEEAARQEALEAAARKKAEMEAAKQAKAEAAARKKEEQANQNNKAEAARQAKAEAASAKKAQMEAAKQAKADAAAAKKEKAEAARLAKAEAAAAKKEKAEAARLAKVEAAAAKKAQMEAAKKARAEAAAKKKKPSSLGQKGGGTISLGSSAESKSPGFFSFGKGEKKPPAGVPIINRWKKNPDGSITGMISGSKSFNEGDKVTTSKLAAGQTVASGNVVVTGSGSKYFLK